MALAAMILVAQIIFDVVMVKADVYMVLVEGDPVAKYKASIAAKFETEEQILKSSDYVKLYTSRLVHQHDNLLQKTFLSSPYKKLYSYFHLINGFAVQITPTQAEMLRSNPQVKVVEKDWRMQKMTTHTPDYLGLPSGLWAHEGGASNAGEDIVIGIIDTGIDPSHPSFSGQSYGPVQKYRGFCEAPPKGVPSFCNGKIVGAQHFAAAATAAGNFNASSDFDSPLDGDGHGTHTASVAAGNYGIPVLINGYSYGDASGMAPRARIAVYKALYRQLGGYVADVVAAIDKAVEDGVDVLNLSVGPNSPPSSTTTFMNVFDMALLAAVKEGVFVAQAAGNGGPYPRTIVSFSPWITTVAAGVDDRSYPNYISLGNSKTVPGIGLAPPSPGSSMYTLVLAKDAVGNTSNFFFSPNDCQDPSLFDRELVRNSILICTYSFSFIFGGATLGQVATTVQNLSAVGFVLVVESDLAGSKFEPVPISTPGMVITSSQHSRRLLAYYNESTSRNGTGKAVHFGAVAKIGNGQQVVFSGSAPQVALYSSRGPDVRDFAFQDADVLKPSILAPGSLIWGAWTPSGTDEPNFQGKNFAMVSGTSMATPHIAGIAALLIKSFPGRSPAAIGSAMMTTATAVDNHGNPMLAQHLANRANSNTSALGFGTPFDYGHGAVNPTAALDPGLIFDAGYDDYINFLCAVPGINPTSIMNATKSKCKDENGQMSDLNLPSITIANLAGSRRIPRTITSVGNAEETYTISYTPPRGVSVNVNPVSFTISQDKVFSFTVILQPRVASDEFSFGEVRLTGNLGHIVRMPVSILKMQLST